MKRFLAVIGAACLLATASCGTGPGQPVQTVILSEPFSSAALAPDCKLLATATSDIQLWDAGAAQPRATLQGHEVEVWKLVFSPDSKVLASADFHSHILLWDVATGKRLVSLRGGLSPVVTLVFSRDGKTLACATRDSTNDVRLWDVSSGQEVATLSPNLGEVHTLDFSPDGKMLALGGGTGGPSRGFENRPYSNCEVRLWDLVARKQVGMLVGHTAYVFRVAFSPDGKFLASGSWDKSVRLWELSSGKERYRVRGPSGEIGWLRFTPDGRFLAAYAWGGSGPGQVKLWDADSGRERLTLDDVGQETIETSPGVWRMGGGAKALRFTPDGKELRAVQMDREVKSWDLAKLLAGDAGK